MEKKVETLSSHDLRCIPNRNNHQTIRYQIGNKNNTAYDRALIEALWDKKINGYDNYQLLFGKSKQTFQPVSKSTVNPVPINIKKTYETTELDNDFYLNLMNWSTNGTVYIGVGCTLYTYKSFSHRWEILVYGLNNDSAYISSLCATHTGVLCSTRFENKSYFSLIESSNGKNIKNFSGKARYSVIRSDESNSTIFYAGNSDGQFARLDSRSPNPLSHFAKKDNQEICGMSICGDKIATGDDGNRVRIWDIKNLKTPVFSYNHKAAVKALTFSPFNNAKLASAGGMADKTIQIWDIKKEEKISTQDAKQQTCNVHWIDGNTLLTTHGEIGKPNLQTWAIHGTDLTLSGAASQADGRTLYSTQNPNNLNLFFTGTAQKRVSLVEVGHEKDTGIYSINHHKNTIR